MIGEDAAGHVGVGGGGVCFFVFFNQGFRHSHQEVYQLSESCVLSCKDLITAANDKLSIIYLTRHLPLFYFIFILVEFST